MAGLGNLPSTDNLLCFLAAAEHLNFRRAASTMALTPTAFGQRIKQLEEQLGAALFERTTRHVALTEAGAALVGAAKEAVESARTCLEAVHDEAPPVSFLLGSRFELAASWLAPVLASLSGSHPHWDIHLYCGSGDDITRRLASGELDCIITSAPFARGGWNAEVIHPETYAFVAAPALLETNPLQTESDCERHTLLDVDSGLPLTRYLLSSPGRRMSFKRERYLGSGGAMQALVRAGQGVAVLPVYMIERELDTGALVRLLPHRALLKDSFRLVYKSGGPLRRIFDELADELRRHPLR